MNPLLGTLKLKSYVVITATGERSAPYGEHPNGYISYADDGRMQVIGAALERVVPDETTSTVEEQLQYTLVWEKV